MTIGQWQFITIVAVIISHAMIASLKFVIVGMMASNEIKSPLDRALLWNQCALAIQYLLWLSVLLLPDHYAEHLRTWYAVWIAESLFVLFTCGWVLREMWRERIAPAWQERVRR